MTLEEWIARYNEKNPQDPYERDERYMLLHDETHGFCECAFTPQMVYIGQICGDGRYWKRSIDDAARALGITHGGTIGIRGNALAYIRFFGYKVVRKEQLPDGLFRYHCIHKETGKGGLVSPSWTYEDGKHAYFITWEV